MLNIFIKSHLLNSLTIQKIGLILIVQLLNTLDMLVRLYVCIKIDHSHKCEDDIFLVAYLKILSRRSLFNTRDYDCIIFKEGGVLCEFLLEILGLVKMLKLVVPYQNIFFYKKENTKLIFTF